MSRREGYRLFDSAIAGTGRFYQCPGQPPPIFSCESIRGFVGLGPRGHRASSYSLCYRAFRPRRQDSGHADQTFVFQPPLGGGLNTRGFLHPAFWAQLNTR